MLVPATVAAMVMMMMVVTAAVITRAVIFSRMLVSGGDGYARGATYGAADNGTITPTYRIAHCCAGSAADGTTKNCICCRAGLGCAGSQTQYQNGNPLVHVHFSRPLL